MRQRLVGPHVAVATRVVGRGRRTGAGARRAGQRGHVRFDLAQQADERPQRQALARREAARVGDEGRPRHGVAIDLGQPVDRRPHGVRVRVLQAVDRLIGRQRVQPVVGRQVDDQALEARPAKRLDGGSALAVLGADERHVHRPACGIGGIRVDEVGLAAQARVRRPDRLPGLAAAGDDDGVDERVGQQQRQQLATGVAGAVQDGRAERSGRGGHELGVRGRRGPLNVGSGLGASCHALRSSTSSATSETSASGSERALRAGMPSEVWR